MDLKLDYSNVMDDNIGTEHGLSWSAIEELIPKGKEIQAALRPKAQDNTLGFYNLPFTTDIADEIEGLLRQKHFVRVRQIPNLTW